MNAAESEREQIGFKRPSFINVVPTAEVFRGVRMHKQSPMPHGEDKLNASGSARVAITEIDLMDLAYDIWRAKYTIAGFIAFAVVLALLNLMFAKKTYTAQAVLGPAESSAQSGLSSSLGQFAGAANLLGVNLGPTGDTDFVKFKTLLTSERLASALFQSDSLKPVFFGPAWVPGTRTWKRPTDIVFQAKDLLKGILGLPRWKVPGPYSLQDDLKIHLGILTDKVTGYITVSISGESPAEATDVLRAIIMTADGLIRQAVKDRTAGRIAYLHNLLQQTSLQDQREAIITVLSAQEKTMMMTSADRTYAIDMIDPPSTNPLPTSPKPTVMVTMLALVAALGVALWAVLRGHFYVRAGGGPSEPAARNPSLDAVMRAWLGTRWTRLTRRNSRVRVRTHNQ